MARVIVRLKTELTIRRCETSIRFLERRKYRETYEMPGRARG